MSKNKAPVFVSLDLETTGFNPAADEIIEVGLLKFTYNSQGQLVELDKLSQLVGIKGEIPEIVQIITGIKNADLKGQPTIKGIFPKIKELLKDTNYIVGHNVEFDLSFLKDILPKNIEVFDTLFWAETFFPGLQSYSLDVLHFELQIERGRAHRAYDDCLVTAKLFLKALNRFLSLAQTNSKIAVLPELFAECGLPQGQVLKTAAEIITLPTTEDSATKTQPTTKTKNHSLKLPNIVLSKPQILITYQSSFGQDLDVIKSLLKKLNPQQTLVVAMKNRTDISEFQNLTYFGDTDQQICLTRLYGLKSTTSADQATTAAKLMVSHTLANDFSIWPRFSNTERNWLQSFWVREETCHKHLCPNYQKIQKLHNSKGSWSILHAELASLPKLSPDTTLVISDFDDAIDSLQRKLEIRFNAHAVPNLLSVFPKLQRRPSKNDHNLTLDLDLPRTAFDNLEQLVEEALIQNDLFWGSVGVAYQNDLDQNNHLYLTPALLADWEFKQIKNSALKLSGILEQLIKPLNESSDPFSQILAVNIGRFINEWTCLIEPEKRYHVYLEINDERISFKLTPTFSTVSERFHSLIPKHTILTASQSSDSLHDHYLSMLAITDWPKIKLPQISHSLAQLKLVKTNENQLEACNKILLNQTYERAVIITKNQAEAEVLSRHLQTSFPDKKILSVEGGAAKTAHQFTREKEAIIIIPSRSHALHMPWPSIDLALICSIPFPAPEPALSFLDSSLPKALLASKTILNKIIRNGSDSLRIFLLDQRLLKQQYGKNFVGLAEELCGNSHEQQKI